MIHFDDSISVLPGIGPKRALLFQKLGLHSVYDLISFFPRTYEDRTGLTEISRLEPNVPACFEAMVVKAPTTRLIRKGMELTHVTVADASGKLQLTFFNQKYSAGKLEYGESYYFYGAISEEYRGYGMTNPSFERISDSGTVTRCVLPVYSLTEGLSNKIVQKTILAAMDACLDSLPEFLPDEIRLRYNLCDTKTAYRMIHAPKTQAEVSEARRRLVFEEYFIFSCGLTEMRMHRSGWVKEPFENTDLTAFYSSLPFSLTDAQLKAIADITADMKKHRPMDRLIQGDVGSGKTMVAAAAVVLTVQNGQQAAFMVPTEILAKQHYLSLKKLFDSLGIRSCLLTGAVGAAERRTLLDALANGEVDVAIGTHALFSEQVVYQNLGLVIADEQHRFGVSQRDALQKKGNHPHLLVMSATPIPRTLALLMYGDLDVTILDEKPAGRKEIQTFLVGESMRQRINAFIRKQVSDGHQVYIVCPAVEDADGIAMKSVETWAKTLQEVVFPSLRVSLLHGQMRPEEKDSVMEAFVSGESDILVATTVIEVGVDVPSATLIVIEDADRFGLSQLHQLRGRVGRGEAQSYCVLFSNVKNPDTRERLEALCHSSDGFKIAEKDLELRGPGDFFGSRQSGLPAFRTADLDSDINVLLQAKEASVYYFAHKECYDGIELLNARIRALFAGTGEMLN